MLALTDDHLTIGPGLLALALAVVAVIEATRLAAALRDRSPDVPPPGPWWWVCELWFDHRLLRRGGADGEPAYWQCLRCGVRTRQRPIGGAADGYADAEQQRIRRDH
ncbi:MAG: hypothetical protein ABWY33_07795 [Cellulomonas sp.]